MSLVLTSKSHENPGLEPSGRIVPLDPLFNIQIHEKIIYLRSLESVKISKSISISFGNPFHQELFVILKLKLILTYRSFEKQIICSNSNLHIIKFFYQGKSDFFRFNIFMHVHITDNFDLKVTPFFEHVSTFEDILSL